VGLRFDDLSFWTYIFKLLLIIIAFAYFIIVNYLYIITYFNQVKPYFKMKQKNSYNYQDLIDCGKGILFGEGNAKLPLPPMLMFDRITKIENNTGSFKRGYLESELDIKDDLWFFKCHFQNDPVMPGCLGLDAMWQLVGFYLGWTGEPGKGRALGVSNVKFTGEVLEKVKIATYKIDIKRILKKEGAVVGLANGTLDADGKTIYVAENLKVGLFKS
jgi:3-hydroxyacyl-[acyl-carrier protein] dehydratase/trans-2-decenoyl-[acyl-carrier protein] isomerase